MEVTLKSSDGEEFVVEESVARESKTLLHMIEDGCADDVIPVPNVNSNILAKVIEYCTKHAEYASKLCENRPFDAYISKAANYLNIQELLDLTCQTVADMIKRKTPEEIQRMYNIKDDFTPEEEEEVRRKNPWAFD